MPLGAVKVDRTTKWGNPFVVSDDRTQAESVSAFTVWLTVDGCDAVLAERKAAILSGLPSLRGKSLACWHRVGTPCHADVLLKLANE